MKKLKVAITNNILELLKKDSSNFKVNMNFLSNSIVHHYLTKNLVKENLYMKKEKELQFFLHTELKENYLKFLILKNYRKEVDFLREAFLTYSRLSKMDREKIPKIYNLKYKGIKIEKFIEK